MSFQKNIKKALRPFLPDVKTIPQMLSQLVWHPYLQQLTDTSVHIYWATHLGLNPMVEYHDGDGHFVLAEGYSRQIPYRVRLWPYPYLKLHRVALTGLKPNTKYYYRLFNEGAPMLPQQYLSFRTAPETGSNLPFNFVAFGDFGNGSVSQHRLRDQLQKDQFQFILTVGDNSQGQGQFYQLNSTIFKVYEDIFCRAGLFTTLGNHDYETHDAAPSLSVFDTPRQALREWDQKRYYSFDYGNVHFVVLDSNRPLDDDSLADSNNMLTWLKQDLANTAQPWKVVTCHHPPYNLGKNGEDERVKTHLVPIFEEYNVDLVISGHEHNYQRSKPLRNHKVATAGDGGVIYLVSGAGAGAKRPLIKKEADWLGLAIASENQGLYNRITVAGHTMIVKTIDETGTERDTFKLQKTSLPLPQLQMEVAA